MENTTNRNKVRRFTQNDWYAWAGAEKFNEKSDPWIYEQKLGECELTAIADKNGLHIYLYSDEEDETLGYEKSMSLTAIRAQGELIHLADELATFTYAPDLTYCLDHPDRVPFIGYTCQEM